jgi:hypothetical protein
MSLYVYAFALVAKGSARRLSMEGHRLELARIADVEVVFERLASRPSLSEDGLREQHEIVERLGRRFDAVLPARFGSFLPEDDLERIVNAHRAELRQSLRRVRECVQMTIRIATPPAASPDHARTESGSAYLNARRAALSASPPRAAAALTASVRTLLHDERTESDRQRGRTALFHLIERGAVKRYRASIASVPLADDDHVTLTGPFAPFAFTPELWT